MDVEFVYMQSVYCIARAMQFMMCRGSGQQGSVVSIGLQRAMVTAIYPLTATHPTTKTLQLIMTHRTVQACDHCAGNMAAFLLLILAKAGRDLTLSLGE